MSFNFRVLAQGLILALSAASSTRAQTFIDLYTLGHSNQFFIPSPSAYQPVASGSVVGGGPDFDNGSNDHAVLWNAANPQGIDLTPANFLAADAEGVSGNQQVGTAFNPSLGAFSACIWSGTASSYLNIGPSTYFTSNALGTNGSQQVGYANQTNYYGTARAFLWNGSSASAKDLTPSGFAYAVALGTDGAHQVGYGGPTTDDRHAVLWTGSASSYKDLNPTGFTFSSATAVADGQEVGSGYNGTNDHALLWNGASTVAVDLNPDGYSDSFALGVSGGMQVGYAEIDGDYFSRHAIFWSGSASSAIDLSASLPNTFSGAEAYQIVGNTVYGLATDMDGNQHAVAWIVPEPNTLLIAIGATAATALRRRRVRS